MDSVCEGAGASGVSAAGVGTGADVPVWRTGADGRSGELHYTPDRVLGAVPANGHADGDAGAEAASEAGESGAVPAAAGAVFVLLCDAAPVDLRLSVLGL